MVATADVGGVACADSAYVYVVCNFFQTIPADSALQDTTIQRELSDIWDLSLPGDPAHGLEQDGYLIRGGNNLEFHRFPRYGDLCGIEHDLADFQQFEGSDGDLIGIVHTHPIKADTVPNFGNCGQEGRSTLIWGSGPSDPDFVHVAKANYYRPGNNVRGYLVDRDSVTIFWADWDQPAQRAINQGSYQEPRDTTCQID